MEWEASEALGKTAWVIAGFCRGKVSAVDVSFSFTFPHPLYFRINFLKWLMCPWDFCVMLNLPSVCHLSMASNDAGIQRGENYPILCGGTSGPPSAAELGCYQPVMKLPSAISSLACGTSSESPGRSTLQLRISSTGATGHTERLWTIDCNLFDVMFPPGYHLIAL